MNDEEKKFFQNFRKGQSNVALRVLRRDDPHEEASRTPGKSAKNKLAPFGPKIFFSIE
jgi:hypothetical protein